MEKYSSPSDTLGPSWVDEKRTLLGKMDCEQSKVITVVCPNGNRQGVTWEFPAHPNLKSVIVHADGGIGLTWEEEPECVCKSDDTFCSYVNFKRRMKTLKRFLSETNRLERLMQGMDEYNQKPSFGGFLADEYVKVLAENIGDNTGQIAAFVWDNNWGATGDISSIKKLYKAIVNEDSDL